jgi:putative FmdB family regulatory protein
MPRYRYRCNECGDEKITFHSYDEKPSLNCGVCLSTNSLQKMVGSLYLKTKKTSPSDQAVGQITKEYIEENKKILEEQKKKARNETYEPS